MAVSTACCSSVSSIILWEGFRLDGDLAVSRALREKLGPVR